MACLSDLKFLGIISPKCPEVLKSNKANKVDDKSQHEPEREQLNSEMYKQRKTFSSELTESLEKSG